MPNYPTRLAEALYQYRQNNKIPLTDCIRVIGLAQTTVFDIERGKIQPTFHALRTLAALFGWTAEEIGALVLEMPNELTRYYFPARFGLEELQGESTAVMGGDGSRTGHREKDAAGDLRGGQGHHDSNDEEAGGVFPVDAG